MSGMIAQVPGSARDWTPECERSNEAVRVAAQRVVDAQTASELEASTMALRGARARFGRAMLALDHQRRPSFYETQNP